MGLLKNERVDDYFFNIKSSNFFGVEQSLLEQKVVIVIVPFFIYYFPQ